jgi:hypothetical protein
VANSSCKLSEAITYTERFVLIRLNLQEALEVRVHPKEQLNNLCDNWPKKIGTQTQKMTEIQTCPLVGN